jgi:hypothetical protein
MVLSSAEVRVLTRLRDIAPIGCVPMSGVVW